MTDREPVVTEKKTAKQKATAKTERRARALKRRAISIKGETYNRISAYCAQHGLPSMSGFVEDLIIDRLGMAAPGPIATLPTDRVRERQTRPSRKKPQVLVVETVVIEEPAVIEAPPVIEKPRVQFPVEEEELAKPADSSPLLRKILPETPESIEAAQRAARRRAEADQRAEERRSAGRRIIEPRPAPAAPKSAKPVSAPKPTMAPKPVAAPKPATVSVAPKPRKSRAKPKLESKSEPKPAPAKSEPMPAPKVAVAQDPETERRSNPPRKMLQKGEVLKVEPKPASAFDEDEYVQPDLRF